MKELLEKAKPLPWSINEKEEIIVDADGKFITDYWVKEEAELICYAVNNIESLQATNQRLEEDIEKANDSKNAGWAIAKSRLEVIDQLQARVSEAIKLLEESESPFYAGIKTLKGND